jgi:hypothetical protein
MFTLLQLYKSALYPHVALRQQGSGNLPPDCRSAAADRRLVLMLSKVVAKGALTRFHRVIISLQPLRDKAVAL